MHNVTYKFTKNSIACIFEWGSIQVKNNRKQNIEFKLRKIHLFRHSLMFECGPVDVNWKLAKEPVYWNDLTLWDTADFM